MMKLHLDGRVLVGNKLKVIKKTVKCPICGHNEFERVILNTVPIDSIKTEVMVEGVSEDFDKNTRYKLECYECVGCSYVLIFDVICHGSLSEEECT